MFGVSAAGALDAARGIETQGKVLIICFLTFSIFSTTLSFIRLA